MVKAKRTFITIVKDENKSSLTENIVNLTIQQTESIVNLTIKHNQLVRFKIDPEDVGKKINTD